MEGDEQEAERGRGRETDGRKIEESGRRGEKCGREGEEGEGAEGQVGTRADK